MDKRISFMLIIYIFIMLIFFVLAILTKGNEIKEIESSTRDYRHVGAIKNISINVTWLGEPTDATCQILDEKLNALQTKSVDENGSCFFETDHDLGIYGSRYIKINKTSHFEEGGEENFIAWFLIRFGGKETMKVDYKLGPATWADYPTVKI